MADVEYGKITESELTRIRARIGQGFEKRRPWRTEVTVDAIYHLALAIGDLSPLYVDEDYAKKSRWGTLLAPPIMIQCFDTLRAVGMWMLIAVCVASLAVFTLIGGSPG